MIRRQRGFTLTGLMISIALAQIVVLVSIKLQASHHSTIEDIRVSSAHNRALSTALITSLKEIQAAGYGIAGASQSDMFIRNRSATSAAPAQTSILWRFRGDDGLANCRGLLESGVTIDGKDFRKLELVSSGSGCDFTTSMATIPYDTAVGTLGLWEIDDLLETYLGTNITLFNFQLNPGNCAVARLADTQPRVIATVSVPNTAELNGNTVPSNVHDVCLLNIT